LETLGVKPIRTCNDCEDQCFSEELLPLWFVKAKNSKYGYRNLCIPCSVKRTNAYPKNKDWKTDHQTKKRYGVDVDTYKERMSAQKSCEICGKTEELCYDHCHTTMKFRGVLCRGCNRSIGQLGDSLEDIMRVVKYLEKAAK
jgi:hypothetical protein